MSENPHVRAIHIFSPKDELRIDDGDPRRRPTTKRSANPVAGLLDEADAAERGTAEGAVAESPAAPGQTGGAPSRKAPSASAPVPDERTMETGAARSDEPLLGDMPEIIQGDFPDPVDL